MNNMLSRKIKIGLSLGISGILMLSFGHACSQFAADGSGTLVATSLDDEKILLNAKTVSTVYSKQVLDNMVSCLGMDTPSLETKGTWANVRGSISKVGKAKDLNAPMLMAITSIAGQVCGDLIQNESNMSSSSDRLIFSEIDFDQNGVDGLAIDNGIRRLTRSCWGRNESSEEYSAIYDSLSEGFNLSDADPANVAQFMCTAVLSSFESIQM